MAIQNAVNLIATGILCHDGSGSFSGRTLTGTSDFIDVTNGSGVSGNPTVDIAANFKATGKEGWNGSIIETPDITVSSNGSTVTLSIEQNGGGDLTVVFSDGYYTWDTTPADTVTLTAGSDTSPSLNYVYFLQSSKTLTASTVGWPSAEYAPIGTFLIQSAASVQTYEPYKVHQWTDHVVNTTDEGHIGHLNYWIRSQPATYIDGVNQSYTITSNAGSADNVIFETASGNVLQLHPHAFPAFSAPVDYYVVNDNSTPYNRVTDLNGLLTDSGGSSMSGRYFSLVIWGCVSEDTGQCKLFVNLPSGSYTNQTGVEDDSDRYANYTIPSEFTGTGFLISEWKLQHQTTASGTWTSIDEIDLRGLFPTLVAGGSATGAVEFPDNTFRIFDEADDTSKIAFVADNISTSTVRSITVPDQDVDLTPTTGTFQGSDGDLTALSALASTGMLARTAADTYALRTITAGTGITVANGDGVSGNPTISVTNSGNIQVATVQLTAAQIKDLHNTPITIVSAPGIGNVTIVHQWAMKMNVGSEVFTGGSNLSLYYTDKNTQNIGREILDSVVQAAADTWGQATLETSPEFLNSDAENAAVVIQPVSTAFAGNASNDGTLDVWVWYSTLTP